MDQTCMKLKYVHSLTRPGSYERFHNNNNNNKNNNNNILMIIYKKK